MAALLGAPPAPAAEGSYRWQGHDFAFCFVSDDGACANLAWADTAEAMGFRFTIAAVVRSTPPVPAYLTPGQLHELHTRGFEIAQHGRSHGWDGLGATCPVPPRGSWMGYFLCEDPPAPQRLAALAPEISPDTIAVLCDIPRADVRVAAYPRHLHGRALIDSLIAAGYLAARTGGKWAYSTNSYGDFTTVARNSWDGGISLYRLPIGMDTMTLFGDHSANPPVYKTYEQFLAVAQPLMDQFRAGGGIFALYAHHLGDYDDSYGNTTYGSGGLTKQDLAWIVDLVRANNGIVMTFGDAVAYYRARSAPAVIDGDVVFVADLTAVPPSPAPELLAVRSYPNPFNPQTAISLDLAAPAVVQLRVYDLCGRLVRLLGSGPRAEGTHRLAWDGRDDRGLPVAAGTYLLRVQAGPQTLTRKLTLLK